MSSIKGWQGKIKYSNRIVFEAVATGSGGSGQSYDLGYEADDEHGVITDDNEKIEVFLDGVLQSTTGIYTLDGDGGTAGVGLLTLTGSHDGEVIEASYYSYQLIGYVKTVNFSFGNNLEEIFGLGSRAAIELKEGNLEIGLAMTRAFIDLGLISTVSHQIDPVRGWLASELFDIEVYPEGDTSGDPIITVQGKFNTGSLDLSQDGVLMDSVDFKGLSVAESTV